MHIHAIQFFVFLHQYLNWTCFLPIKQIIGLLTQAWTNHCQSVVGCCVRSCLIQVNEANSYLPIFLFCSHTNLLLVDTVNSYLTSSSKTNCLQNRIFLHPMNEWRGMQCLTCCCDSATGAKMTRHIFQIRCQASHIFSRFFFLHLFYSIFLNHVTFWKLATLKLDLCDKPHTLSYLIHL